MPAVSGRHRFNARKASNAENLVPRAKHVPYKASRLATSHPLRDSSSRRRNRVLSGFSASYSIVNHVKRQRLARPQVVRTLPTPPASPGTRSVDVDMEVESSASSTGARPTSQPSSQINTTTINLPRRLERPPRVPLQEEAVEAVDPANLDGIPAGYVRDATEYLTPGMARVLAGIKIQPQAVPRGQGFPKELAVIANDISAQMPTHILAVPTPIEQSRTKVEMYPVHHIVVATQCARLTLPPSQPPAPTTPGSTITLPVVPISLPHPESFLDIESFLYTRNPEAFLASLLPRAPPKSTLPAAQTYDRVHFSEMLADTFTPQAILRHLKHTHGVYRNMCVLGIQDDRMWHLLNMAWEILFVTAVISSRRYVPVRF